MTADLQQQLVETSIHMQTSVHKKMRRNNRIVAIFPLLLLFLLYLLHSASAGEIYDLKRCLETGLAKNYDLLIIRNEQRISDNNLSWGNAGFLPTVDLSAGYSGALNNTAQEYADGSNLKNTAVPSSETAAGLSLSWTVFDGLYMQTTYRRLKEFQKMGELNTRLTVENLICDITAEYYNYVYQNLRLANLQYAVSLSKERLRIVAARYSIGSMSRLDLQQAQVDFNADSSSLIKQYEVVNTSRITLNRLMAPDDVSQDVIAHDTFIALNSSLVEQELRNNMHSSNILLLLSANNKTVGELDYKALKSRNYPYLKLSAGYGYTRNLYGTGSLNRQDNIGLTYGLTLGLTLFDGFNRRREQKNARLTIQNRQLQYEQLELSLRADLANIWMAYKNNLKLITLERENVNVARENYEIAIERYRLGELSGIELREAQNSLLGAEERLLQAQYNTKLCEISLMQISGQATVYLG
jgi:outer membrane protein TolC